MRAPAGATLIRPGRLGYTTGREGRAFGPLAERTFPRMSELCPLSVVVAAYNEQAVIEENLRRIVEELESHGPAGWELICVDDGSADRTAELMTTFAADRPAVRVLRHRRNYGQGRALRTAFAVCRGEVIVTLDADLSYGPQYIGQLCEALEAENVEIALASAYAPGGSVANVPALRLFLSRYGNRYLSRTSPYGVSTSTCVVRAYRREVIERLELTSDGMELQLEILMKAAMLNFRVTEIPARLAWAEQKADEARGQRRSKMRILRTIRDYLMMGWLARPAAGMLTLGALLAVVGLVLLADLPVRLVGLALGADWPLGPHAWRYACGGAGLLFGVQLFATGLLAMQNKHYFEELYRLGQRAARRGGGADASHLLDEDRKAR